MSTCHPRVLHPLSVLCCTFRSFHTYYSVIHHLSLPLSLSGRPRFYCCALLLHIKDCHCQSIAHPLRPFVLATKKKKKAVVDLRLGLGSCRHCTRWLAGSVWDVHSPLLPSHSILLLSLLLSSSLPLLPLHPPLPHFDLSFLRHSPHCTLTT